MDVDPWLPPDPPHPPGGTRLPHLFGALARHRMTDLVRGVTDSGKLNPLAQQAIQQPILFLAYGGALVCSNNRPSHGRLIRPYPKKGRVSLGISNLLQCDEEPCPAKFHSLRKNVLNSQDACGANSLQVELLPRAEWSAAEVTHGLSDAVQCLLSCVTVRVCVCADATGTFVSAICIAVCVCTAWRLAAQMNVLRSQIITVP